MTEVHHGVKVQLFVGCLLSPELKMHLQHSLEWQKALTALDETSLRIVRHKDKDYVGRYTDSPAIPFETLKIQSAAIVAQLEGYCPDSLLRSLSMNVISQLFLS